MDFILHNPGVQQARAFVLSHDLPGKPNVNLANNSRLDPKKIGLTQVKKGHMKQQDIATLNFSDGPEE